MTRDSIGWSLTVGMAIGLIGLYTHTSPFIVDLIFAFGFFFGIFVGKVIARKEFASVS